jgi:hypothetical protein
MRIQTFRNGKGLIYGADPKRIGCAKEGVLKIGTTEISISPENESIMPLLFNGCTGEYNASFADKDGNTFALDRVVVRGGRIAPPPQSAVEFMELRCRIDELEAECERLEERCRELANIFDTNSLNFLIN